MIIENKELRKLLRSECNVQLMGYINIHDALDYNNLLTNRVVEPLAKGIWGDGTHGEVTVDRINLVLDDLFPFDKREPAKSYANAILAKIQTITGPIRSAKLLKYISMICTIRKMRDLMKEGHPTSQLEDIKLTKEAYVYLAAIVEYVVIDTANIAYPYKNCPLYHTRLSYHMMRSRLFHSIWGPVLFPNGQGY